MGVRRYGNGFGVRRSHMDEAELKARLHRMAEEHRDLDTAIEALSQLPSVDALQLQRLKRRRLKLKDEISLLNDLLLPDIIA